MDRGAGPVSLAPAEEVLCSVRTSLLVDDDVPVDSADFLVTNQRLVVAAVGRLYDVGAPQWTLPITRVVLHARMPPDLASDRSSVYLQLDGPGAAGPSISSPTGNGGSPSSMDGWASLAWCMELRIIPRRVLQHASANDDRNGADGDADALLDMVADAMDRAFNSLDDESGSDDGEHGAFYFGGGAAADGESGGPRPAIG
jgi:hypothetical protein